MDVDLDTAGMDLKPHDIFAVAWAHSFRMYLF